MAAAARKANWFAIWTSVGVVAVLVAIGAIVVVMNNTSSAPGPAPTAAGIDQTTGAIAVGSGPDTLDTYVDFMCPVCNQFEQVYGEAIQGLVDDGSITLNIHPIAILDSRSQGTEYSSRSASAMYCVAENDPGAVVPFLQAMYTNQPAEGTPGLTDEEIVGIAEGAGAANSAACITDGSYVDFVASMTPNTPVAPGAGGIGTPTVAVNGEVISNSTLPDPAELATLFG